MNEREHEHEDGDGAEVASQTRLGALEVGLDRISRKLDEVVTSLRDLIERVACLEKTRTYDAGRASALEEMDGQEAQEKTLQLLRRRADIATGGVAVAVLGMILQAIGVF